MKFILYSCLLFLNIFNVLAQEILPMGKGVGMNGTISIVKSDSIHHRVFVSGRFDRVSGVSASGIAFMDSNGWHPMGSVYTQNATAIEISDSNVFVGGSMIINDSVSTQIAEWNGSSWYELGAGISGGSITQMAYYQHHLYVIGSFTVAGDSTVNGAVSWDGLNWSSFSFPSAGKARDLFVHDTSLYLVTESSNYPNTTYELLRYNGSSFDSITQIIVYLTSYGNSLFLNDTICFAFNNSIRVFDGIAWHSKFTASSAFGLLGAFEINHSLYLLVDSSYKHYSIRRIQDSSLSSSIGNLRVYDSINYSSFSIDYDVLDGTTYIGGTFSFINNIQCPAFAKFDGVSFSSVGWFAAGYGTAILSSNIYSSYFDSATNNLYVSGRFTWADDSMAYGIARWDGVTWHPMGNGLNGFVYSVTKYNGEIYAGGSFVSSDGDPVHYVARWDGIKWNEVVGGATNIVRCLAVHNNKLIAAGWFTTIGGSLIPYIAQYDGTAWTALPGGVLTGAVHALNEIDGILYAGGYASIYGGSTAKYMTSWSSMGSFQDITSFTKYNDTIYMSTTEPKMYKRNGYSWESLDYVTNWFQPVYSQIFDLDHHLCASSQIKQLQSYNSGIWSDVLSPVVFSCTKMNDSAYFLGGVFSGIYTANGALDLSNVAIYLSVKPTATIATSSSYICKHQYVFYKPVTDDVLLKYQWHLPGGFPDTSSQYKPVALYDTVGVFGAYAVINNWNGSDTIYLQDSIHVTDCGPPVSHSYDNVWTLGYQYSPYDPMPGLDFYYGAADSMGYSSPFSFGFDITNASICDTNGILQFYTNGEQVANRYDEILDSSKNFNDDEFFENNFYSYSPFSQSAIILPFPNHSNQYYIIHTSPRYDDNQTFLAPFQLWYSIVDMDENEGHGKMIVKQQAIFYDTLTFSTLQAEHHVNGRDWWIIVHKYNSDKFYVMLLTPNGIEQINLQSAGPVIESCNYGQSIFSPDGKKYAFCYRDSDVLHLFDFDRCAGTLDYNTSVYFDKTDPGNYFQSCAFSPDNHYLYVSNYTRLFQMDTACLSVDSCMELIGEYDNYGDPIQTIFWQMALAPDDKIYMATWNGCEHYHVINSPDSAEAGCNFVQHQLKLVSYNIGTMPQFPNFRAGALTNNLCDTSIATLIVSPAHEFEVLISPNPASEFITISFKNSDEKKTVIKIFNSSLQKMSEVKIDNPQSPHTINISSWNKGIYFCQVSNGKEILWKKIVIQ